MENFEALNMFTIGFIVLTCSLTAFDLIDTAFGKADRGWANIIVKVLVSAHASFSFIMLVTGDHYLQLCYGVGIIVAIIFLAGSLHECEE